MSPHDRALVEFLTACIEEDEAWCRRLRVDTSPGDPDDPGRILAECEARRHAIKWAAVLDEPSNDLATRQAQEVVRYMFRAMAWGYSGHPFYQQEWKP